MNKTGSPKWASDTHHSVDGGEALTVWIRRASRPVVDRSGDLVEVTRHQMSSVWENNGTVMVDRSAERVVVGGLELSVGQADALRASLGEVLEAQIR